MRLTPTLLVPAVLGAGLLIVYREALSPDRVLYFRDLFFIFIPAWRLITTSVSQGIAPWWNPHLFAGVPLAADVVHGLFYPPSVVFYLLPIHWAFKLFVVGHCFLAGVSFYLLMRQWTLPPLPATFGAVTFALSGYLLSMSNVLNFLPGAAWLPLALAWFLRALEPGGARWIIPTGVVVALQALTDPQSVLFSGCLMGLWSLLPGERPWARHVRRGLTVAAAAGLLAALLAAVQLMPLLELYPRSDRYGGLPRAMTQMWPLAPFRLVEFLAPQVYGDAIQGTYWGWIFQGARPFGKALAPWLLSPYLGIPPLVLAVFALVRMGRDARVRFCGIGGLLATLLALGEFTPVQPLLYQAVPVLRLFRFPAKWVLLVTLALAALASIALTRLGERHPADARLTRLVLGAVLACAVGLGTALFVLTLHPDAVGRLLGPYVPAEVRDLLASYVWRQIVIHGFGAVLLAIATVLPLYALLRGRITAPLAQGALLLLLIGDLVLHNERLTPLAPREILDGEPPLVRFLRRDPELFRIHRLTTAEEAMVTLEQRESFYDLSAYAWSRATLRPNTVMDYGLFEFWGTGAVRLADYTSSGEVIRRSWPLPLRFLGAWNVKYVIVTDTELDDPLLEAVPAAGGDPRVRVYRNRAVLPRAFWVPRARWLPDRSQLLRALPEFDPRREVLLEGPVPAPAPPPDADGSSRVEIVAYRPNEVVIRCTVTTSGFLVLADADYPGWRASVDGRDHPILRANHAMRAVPLGAGEHEVRFRYEPWSVTLGATISLMGLVVSGGVAAWAFRRGPRYRSDP